jgi:hypothetical protein
LRDASGSRGIPQLDTLPHGPCGCVEPMDMTFDCPSLQLFFGG